jgi:hypothetical protein
MYDTNKTVFQTRGCEFYKALLSFYPTAHRKRFGEQMLITFQDMYQEEVATQGKAGFRFWSSLILDTIQSIISQHVHTMIQQGFKKYFHINTYNIVGGTLLLPFALIFMYGMIGRIVQGDLIHYNRSFEGALSHSFIYANYFGKPWVSIAIAIVFPAVAVLINLISLFTSIKKAKKLSPKRLFLTNPIAVLITLIGLSFLVIIVGHDVVPCMWYGITHFGFGQLGHIVSVCRNA